MATLQQDAQPLAPLPFFLALMPPNSEDALKFVPAEYKHLLAPDSPLADLVRPHTLERTSTLHLHFLALFTVDC